MRNLYQEALGTAWSRLPLVLQRHYGLAPGDTIAARGVMHRVYHKPILTPVLHLSGWFGLLFPEQGEDVPTTLVNVSGVGPRGEPFVDWQRTLRFVRADGTERVRHFNSRVTLMARGDNTLVLESVALGQAVAIQLSVDEAGGLAYHSTGFYMHMAGVTCPVPVPARIYTREWAQQSEPDTFCMEFTATLPLLGVVLGYEGEFRLESG